MAKTRVLLAEDHTVVRQGLRKILESDAEIEIIGEVGDGRGAVEAAKRLRPTVVVIDIGLPGLNGIEATSQIMKGTEGVSVLILALGVLFAWWTSHLFPLFFFADDAEQLALVPNVRWLAAAAGVWVVVMTLCGMVPMFTVPGRIAVIVRPIGREKFW